MSQYIGDFLPPFQQSDLKTTEGFVSLAETSTSTTGGYTTPIVAGGSGLVGIYTGAGTPTISANRGSLYLNVAATNGSTRLYINTNDTTGWAAIQTL